MRKLLLLSFVILFTLAAIAKDKIVYIEKFENSSVGDVFKVFDIEGDELTDASAVVEADPASPSSLCLHVKTGSKAAFVEFQNPGNISGSTVLKTYERIYMQFYVPESNTAALNRNVVVILGANSQTVNAASGVNEAGKWIPTTQTLGKASSIRKTVRIGLNVKEGEYYVKLIRYLTTDFGYDYNDPTQTARYYADQLGLNFGVCVSPGQLNDNSRMGQTIWRNFNMMVGENAMKMDATEPSQNGFNFSQGDAILSFAEKHDMKVRGHTLCWHSQIPSWIGNSQSADNPKGWTKKQLLDILKNHIYGVVQHYAGKIVEWDVVNECLADGQSGNGYVLRNNSIWKSVIGEEFIDSAFVWARRAADEAGDYDVKLYLNDYSVDAWSGGKTKALYNLAVRLKNSGVPIDGVGMQTHTQINNYNLSGVKESLEKFKAAGLNCIFTEIDIEGSNPISTTQLKTTQGEKYAGIVDFVCSYDISPTMVVWGISDGNSWLSNAATTKPLLFTADMEAKPAYLAVVNKFKEYAEKAGVGQVYSDESPWGESAVDVYNITGQKIASGVTIDFIDNLPEGLYIVGGRKLYVK